MNEEKQERNRYFIVYKPRNMVSQFISSHEVPLLGDLNFAFPGGTHALGRLDKDSEGLLLLTTNKKITRLLYQNNKCHERVYLVRVNKILSEMKILDLQNGVSITARNNSTYHTGNCKAERVSLPYELFRNDPQPVAEYAHSWLTITLTEGKFHQVRKMVKAIGHRCERLIRLSVERIQLADMVPGEVRELTEGEFFSGLKLNSE